MKLIFKHSPCHSIFKAAMTGLICLLWAAAAPAAIFEVHSTADKVDINPGDGICDADPGPTVECTLRAAIMEANALPNVASIAPGYDMIRVFSGTYTLSIPGRGENAAATGDLDITEQAGIFGQISNRPIIDGGGLDRVFDFRAVGLVKDVVVQGGSVTGSGDPGSGGGVRCVGSIFLYVLNSNVRANFAEYQGGGLSGNGCDLLVGGSLIENNSTNGSGGGIGLTFATLSVGNTTVRSNHAIAVGGGASGGGGISTSLAATDVVYIFNSTISENSADWGAGITFSGRSYLINSTVTGNQGDYGGGAAMRTFGALTITSSTIYCNRSTSTSNEAGIYLQGASASVSINNSILARNTNANGEAECNGPLSSGGYNLFGDTNGCTITGTTTGNQSSLDPLLVGPFRNPIAEGTAGGREVWLPQSMFGPTVDRGNPAGITHDNDADPSTADVLLTSDQWALLRPDDGDRDSTPRSDIGAIESPVIMISGFESDPGACPAP